MDNAPAPAFSAEIEAAFAWWRDAGVDSDFSDEAQEWLAKPQAAIAAAPSPGPPAGERPADRASAARAENPGPAFAAADLPGDLAAFSAWWMAEPKLDFGRTSDRVPPRGSVGAKLMILVPHPEREDGESLLSGPQGRLLDAFLSAAGLTAVDTYVASVLPRHTPQADWPGIATEGFADILARHVALVAPEKLLVLGSNISPLLSNDPAKTSADLRQFNHESGTIPLLADRDLAVLLERPGWKARFWTRWLDWTG